MSENTQQPKTFCPTISVGTRQYPDGSFGATLTVTGLMTQAQADAACIHMQRLFCGQEIKVQG